MLDPLDSEVPNVLFEGGAEINSELTHFISQPQASDFNEMHVDYSTSTHDESFMQVFDRYHCQKDFDY